MGLRPTRIFISPHPDDIAYSCFASLIDPLADLSQTLIVTVFGSSIRAHGALGSRSSAREISAVRLREDATFTMATECHLQSLTFQDSSLRYKEWVPFESLTSRNDPIFLEIKEALRCLIEPLLGRATVFIPLGIGSHIDHCIVRDAVRDIIGECGTKHSKNNLFYFEDLPYASKYSEEEIVKYARTVVSPLTRPIIVDLDGLWSSKRLAIRIYESQLKPTVLPAISQHARRVGGQKSKAERIWVDEADLTTAMVAAVPTVPIRLPPLDSDPLKQVVTSEVCVGEECVLSPGV